MTLSRPDNFDAEDLPLHNKERGLDDFRRNKLAEPQLGSTKFSGVLRSSVSLEEPRVRYIAIANAIPNPVSSIPVNNGRLLAN